MFVLPTIKKARKDSVWAWVVCVSAALFFFFDFLQIGMVAPLGSELVKQFGTRYRFWGYAPRGFELILALTWAFRLGNLLFILPAGWVLTRYKIRPVLLISFACSLLGLGGMILMAGDYVNWSKFYLLEGAMFFRFLSGGAHAFCFLCCAGLARRWFTIKRQGIAMGVIIAVGLSGLPFGMKPIKLFREYVLRARFDHWIVLLWLCFLFGCLAWCLICLTAWDNPLDQSTRDQATQKRKQPVATQALWSAALRHANNWRYSLWIAMINTPVTIFLIKSIPFFMESADLSPSDAASLTTLLGISLVVGNLLISGLELFFRHRKFFLIGGTCLNVLLLLMLIVFPEVPITAAGWSIAPNSFWVRAFLLVALGLVNGVQTLGYVALAECNLPRMRGIAMTCTSLIVMGSLFIGDFIESYVIPEGTTLTRSNGMLYFWPLYLMMLLSLLLLFGVKTQEKPSLKK